MTNSDWQYIGTNPSYYIWKYVGSATFPASGISTFGFDGIYNPQGTQGKTVFTVQIFQGSGGENNLSNNFDGETLIYFN